MTDELERARTLARQGRLEEALKLCLKVIESAPLEVEARELIIALSLKLENLVEWMHHQLELAELQARLSHHEVALKLFDEFLQFPMDGRPQGEQDLHALLKRQVFFQKGLVYRACERPQLAERNFREALALGPDRWETYLELGRTLTKMARYQEAAQVLQDGMRLNPIESGPILEALGDVFHHMGRDARSWYDSAIAHYKRLGNSDDVMRLSARLVDLFGNQYLKDLRK